MGNPERAPTLRLVSPSDADEAERERRLQRLSSRFEEELALVELSWTGGLPIENPVRKALELGLRHALIAAGEAAPDDNDLGDLLTRVDKAPRSGRPVLPKALLLRIRAVCSQLSSGSHGREHPDSRHDGFQRAAMAALQEFIELHLRPTDPPRWQAHLDRVFGTRTPASGLKRETPPDGAVQASTVGGPTASTSAAPTAPAASAEKRTGNAWRLLVVAILVGLAAAALWRLQTNAAVAPVAAAPPRVSPPDRGERVPKHDPACAKAAFGTVAYAAPSFDVASSSRACRPLTSVPGFVCCVPTRGTTR